MTSEGSPKNRALRVAALIKQIPRFEEFSLGTDGRLRRDSRACEINPFCRRALKKAVEIAQNTGGRSVVITMGPPQASEALVEALAVGADETILISDPVMAGSDTLATSLVLAEVLLKEGPFDLVLCGLNSVDSDTGQVGPEVAELLGAAFVSGARVLDVAAGSLQVHCERDDGSRDVVVNLPAVVSVAERLCKPAKATPEQLVHVVRDRVRRVCAADLGAGPWGTEASPTRVGATRLFVVERDGHRVKGDPGEIVNQLVEYLATNAVFEPDLDVSGRGVVPNRIPDSGMRAPVGVVLEPGRTMLNRELLASAALLAHTRETWVYALAQERVNVSHLASWGADTVKVELVVPPVEETCAKVVMKWVNESSPLTVLGPGTSWGREVMGRAAARLRLGLIGDVVEIENISGEVVYWKPAFGGQLLAAITSASPTGMATLRPGVAPSLAPRKVTGTKVVSDNYRGTSKRVMVLAQEHDNSVTELMRARIVVGLGLGVPSEDYPRFEPLLKTMDGELAATRKVTDREWLPRSRQLGVTGTSVAPALYIAFGVSGSFNHMIGVRQARKVIAVNTDPLAPIFDHADFGICADWRDVIEPMTDGIAKLMKSVSLG